MGLKERFSNELLIECGCDEAGRGCLAGPVFAAAVILPLHFFHPLLNDSKKLNEKQRQELRLVIEKEAVAYAIHHVDHSCIDKINILNASFLAMNESVKKLDKTPELLLIDGNRFKNATDIPHHCIVKGDAKFASIAAASILAKTYRDAYMEKIHGKFPYYDWHKNKGYPTAKHREMIQKHGISPYHRKSFQLLPPPTLFDHLESE